MSQWITFDVNNMKAIFRLNMDKKVNEKKQKKIQLSKLNKLTLKGRFENIFMAICGWMKLPNLEKKSWKFILPGSL